MADYGYFQWGNVAFPLTASTTNSLLQDSDPAIYYALDFFSGMIVLHLGSRLVAEATASGATHITSSVAYASSRNPAPDMHREHFKFPLLAVYRKEEILNDRTVAHRHGTCAIEIAYVLPPLRPSESEQLLPILNAAKLVIEQACNQGFDPAYTPPGGSAGGIVWDTAGIERITVNKAKFGSYPGMGDMDFPAVIVEAELLERSEAYTAQFGTFAGANLNVDMAFPDDTVASDVVQDKTWPAPTLTSVTPALGSTAGSTSITLTGTGFRAPATVTVGGIAATSVVVVSSTSITCSTPAHSAYTTFVADIIVTNPDGQDVTLSDAFTYS